MYSIEKLHSQLVFIYFFLSLSLSHVWVSKRALFKQMYYNYYCNESLSSIIIDSDWDTRNMFWLDLFKSYWSFSSLKNRMIVRFCATKCTCFWLLVQNPRAAVEGALLQWGVLMRCWSGGEERAARPDLQRLQQQEVSLRVVLVFFLHIISSDCCTSQVERTSWSGFILYSTFFHNPPEVACKLLCAGLFEDTSIHTNLQNTLSCSWIVYTELPRQLGARPLIYRDSGSNYTNPKIINLAK